MSKIYYIAIDIEKAGDRFTDAILMIGCCLGDESGNVIETKAFCGVVPPNEEFQENCWDEFWSKEQDILAKIRRQSTTTMVKDFTAYFTDLDQRFGPFTREGEKQLIILSDNPTYDIGSIDVLLATDPEKRFQFPQRYLRNGQVRLRVYDSNENLRALEAETAKRIKNEAKREVPHDHWAENDAVVIYKTKILVDRELKKMRPNATPSTNSMRPGDWWCKNCNDFVFASKSECRKCGSKKP